MNRLRPYRRVNRYAVTNAKGLTYFTAVQSDAQSVGKLWAKSNKKVVVKVRRTGRILAKWIDGVRQ